MNDVSTRNTLRHPSDGHGDDNCFCSAKGASFAAAAAKEAIVEFVDHLSPGTLQTNPGLIPKSRKEDDTSSDTEAVKAFVPQLRKQAEEDDQKAAAEKAAKEKAATGGSEKIQAHRQRPGSHKIYKKLENPLDKRLKLYDNIDHELRQALSLCRTTGHLPSDSPLKDRTKDCRPMALGKFFKIFSQST